MRIYNTLSRRKEEFKPLEEAVDYIMDKLAEKHVI